MATGLMNTPIRTADEFIASYPDKTEDRISWILTHLPIQKIRLYRLMGIADDRARRFINDRTNICTIMDEHGYREAANWTVWVIARLMERYNYNIEALADAMLRCEDSQECRELRVSGPGGECFQVSKLSRDERDRFLGEIIVKESKGWLLPLMLFLAYKD